MSRQEDETVDETQMILNAMSQSSPRKRSKKMDEVEPDLFCARKDDPIWKLSESMARKKKHARKPLREWTSADLLKHLNEILSIHDLRLERAAARDREVMSSLYDQFVDCLPEMSNKVMKDYLEWWVSCYAPTMHDREIYVNLLTQENYLKKFLQRYNVTPTTTAPTQERPAPGVDDATLYKMGGLPMLLVSKGIVVSCRLLERLDEKDIFIRISKALRELPKNVLMDVMETTASGSPYDPSDEVDFVSLARPALSFYGLNNYLKLQYKQHFRD